MNFLNKFTRNKMQKNFHERCMAHANVIDMFPRRYGKSVAIAMFALTSALETKSNVLVYDNEQRYLQFLVTHLYEWSEEDFSKENIFKKKDRSSIMFEEDIDGNSNIKFNNGSTIYFVTENTINIQCPKPDLFLFEYSSDNKRLTEEFIPKMTSLGVPMKGVCTELWSSRTNPPDTSVFNINCYYYNEYEDKNALNKRITNHIMTKQISCN